MAVSAVEAAAVDDGSVVDDADAIADELDSATTADDEPELGEADVEDAAVAMNNEEDSAPLLAELPMLLDDEPTAAADEADDGAVGTDDSSDDELTPLEPALLIAPLMLLPLLAEEAEAARVEEPATVIDEAKLDEPTAEEGELEAVATPSPIEDEAADTATSDEEAIDEPD